MSVTAFELVNISDPVWKTGLITYREMLVLSI